MPCVDVGCRGDRGLRGGGSTDVGVRKESRGGGRGRTDVATMTPPRRQYQDKTSRSREAEDASTSCSSSKLQRSSVPHPKEEGSATH